MIVAGDCDSRATTMIVVAIVAATRIVVLNGPRLSVCHETSWKNGSFFIYLFKLARQNASLEFFSYLAVTAGKRFTLF